MKKMTKEEIRKYLGRSKEIRKRNKKYEDFAEKYILENGGTDEDLVPIRRNDWF